MRQLSPATNLALSCLSALGLLATLSLPWFAPPVPDTTDTDGPVERTAWAISRVFTHHDHAISGSDALGSGRTLVYLLAAAVLSMAALATVQRLRAYLRDALRAIALATPLLIFALALQRPGTSATLNLHWGLLVALGVAVLAASCAWHGSEIRGKRAPAGSWARPAKS
jgi:hypothetical protein